jgi:hypothetical protein
VGEAAVEGGELVLSVAATEDCAGARAEDDSRTLRAATIAVAVGKATLEEREAGGLGVGAGWARDVENLSAGDEDGSGEDVES